MIGRKGLISATALMLAMGSAAFADESQNVASPSNGPDTIQVADAFPQSDLATHPLLGDASSPPPTPLMQGLDDIGIGKVLTDWGITITGYADIGYLYDMTVPKDISPAKHAPSDLIYFPGPYKNRFLLDQVDLAVSRAVDASKGKFDVGFTVEGIYGVDAYYTHANGILDNNNKHGDTGPDDQLDLEQAFVTFAVPVGSGLTLEVGKFVTLMGEETINPTTNAFYTHSYAFSYGVPLTQTGILGSYNLTSTLSVTAGVTRGWNQATSDNNSAVDFLGEATYTSPDSKLKVVGNLSEGPESTLNYGPGDDSHYWTVPELIPSYKLSDQLTVTGDFLYGIAPSYGQWYSAVGYGSYTIDKYFTTNLRAEVYDDGRGYTTGAPVTTIYSEAALNLAITPLPDNTLLNGLVVRPEIRVDFANHPVYDTGKWNEVVFAVDAYVKF